MYDNTRESLLKPTLFEVIAVTVILLAIDQHLKKDDLALLAKLACDKDSRLQQLNVLTKKYDDQYYIQTLLVIHIITVLNYT